jgi:hypothetical protein
MSLDPNDFFLVRRTLLEEIELKLVHRTRLEIIEL